MKTDEQIHKIPFGAIITSAKITQVMMTYEMDIGNTEPHTFSSCAEVEIDITKIAQKKTRRGPGEDGGHEYYKKQIADEVRQNRKSMLIFDTLAVLCISVIITLIYASIV